MVDAAYISWVRRAHLPVRVWTVDDEAEMRRVTALGVDAVITNVPELMIELSRSSLAGS
jgi:glycerophosphoryl diester phosphodiesterase